MEWMLATRINGSRKVKGFGIGLSLVKRIIGLHRGEVSLNSSVNNETNFTVILPVDVSRGI